MRKKMLIVLLALLMLMAHVPAMWACDCCRYLGNLSTGENHVLVDAYSSTTTSGVSFYIEASYQVTRHYCIYSNGSKWNCEILGSC